MGDVVSLGRYELDLHKTVLNIRNEGIAEAVIVTRYHDGATCVHSTMQEQGQTTDLMLDALEDLNPITINPEKP